MQVSGNEKNHIHQTYRSLAPLNCLLKLVGLGCDLTEKKKSKTYCLITKNIIRASILAVVDCFTLFYKISYLSYNISFSIKYTDYVQVIYDYVQYVVDLFYVRKYDDVCLEYFKQYENIDRILVTVNYCTFTKKLLRVMGFFMVLWTSSSVCDFVAWVLSYGWTMAAIYSLMYLFLLIKILTTLDLTSQIMHIECRLRAVADLLETYCKATESGSPLFERNRKLLFDTENTVEDQQAAPSNPKSKSDVGYDEIKWLSRCYLLLTEQATFVNKMYGTRILLNSLSLLIDMVRFTNIAARILIGSQKTTYSSGYVPVISSIMRLLTCAAVLASLAKHCEQVYKQRERIMDIIHNLIIFKNPSMIFLYLIDQRSKNVPNGEEMKTATLELRDLIQARPIDFTMANFFRLDYSLLVSIASVVVTYTIILLQTIN